MGLLNKIYSILAVANCEPGDTSSSCQTNLPEVAANASTVSTILSVVFGIIGATSVILIIFAGMLFITGGDDPQKIKTARNTIIWALLGLGIALSAEAIVYIFLRQL